MIGKFQQLFYTGGSKGGDTVAEYPDGSNGGDIYGSLICWFSLVRLRMMIKYILQLFSGGGSIVFDHNLPARASAISIPLTLKFFVSSDQRKFVIW